MMGGAERQETFVDLLYRHSRTRAQDSALRDAQSHVTWSELDARSNRIANALLAAGVGKGDRVALMTDANVTGALLILGILKAGASVVPIPTLVSDESIAGILDDSEARVLFVSDRFRKNVAQICDASRILHVAIDFADKDWIHLESFLSEVSSDPPDLQIAPQDEFSIIYSSGTTGRPKGIIHSHRTRAAWSAGIQGVAFPQGVRTLNTTALCSNWTFNALTYTLWSGGCVCFLEKFSPSALIAACRTFAPDNIFLVPVQIARMLEDSHCHDELSQLSPAMKWSAGSPLAAEHKRRLMQMWAGGLVEVYGMTEGAPSTILLAHERPDKLHTVGRADPPDSIQIIDENGDVLGPHERGEIVGRAIDVMEGYNNDADATCALIWRDAQGDAYFRSGDTGCLDEDGFLQVLGRTKDMIISGGFNIYAVDIEQTLLKHPAVSQAAAFAVPSMKWGEAPAAAICLKPGASAGAETIMQWTNERLGRLQRLSAVVVLDDLPRGALGKILKRELREAYAHLGDEVRESR